MKKIFTGAMIFTGTVIGAGFASGQEIWIFFGSYGGAGLSGVLLAGIILAVTGMGIFLGISDGDFSSYGEFCEKTGGKAAGSFVAALGTIFMFATVCVMFAGSGALFSQQLGLDYRAGVVFMAVICFLCLIFGIKSVSVINCVLTPLMVLGIMILGFFSIIYGCCSAAAGYSSLLSVSGSFISAIVYVSYNLLAVPSVLVSTPKISKREAVFAGFTGGGLLGALGLIMYLISVKPGFMTAELPALRAANIINANFGVIYGVLIYFSMLTTVIGNAYGLVSAICARFGFSFFPTSAVIILCACAASVLGFSRLVGSLYVSVGYAAVLITVLLMVYSLKKLKKLLLKSGRSTRK